MPARRKKASASKMTATAAPEGQTAEDKPEETRAPITQVVEVIEEEISIPVGEEPTEESPADEPVKTEEKSEETPEEIPEETPTRKSMVEELYTSSRETRVMPEISMHRNGSKKPLVVWALVTIIVALLTGGILFAVSRKPSMPAIFASPTPTPTPAPTPAPTPTPAEVDKESFEIRVLNGGGTVGAAGKMKTFLEDKGYTVSGTGNTPEYTFETTEIHGKANMTDAVAQLKTDLGDSYTLGTVDTDLDASASADVEVIVGKE